MVSVKDDGHAREPRGDLSDKLYLRRVRVDDRVTLASHDSEELSEEFQVGQRRQVARYFDAVNLYAFALERGDERPVRARRVNLEAVRLKRAKLRQEERDSEVYRRDVQNFERRVHVWEVRWRS